MKNLLLSIFVVLVLSGCTNPKQPPKHSFFHAFDFSYNDVFATCFSIKFTQGDTVFIRQHFTNTDTGMLKRNTTYYSVLSEQNRSSIEEVIKTMNFNSYNDRYVDEHLSDGVEYQFYVDKDSTKKTIFVYGDNAPASLDSLARRIAGFKAKLPLIPIDTTIEFGSLKYFLPPEIPPPPVEFIPPKKKKIIK